jgi:hypothetical protein
MNPQLETNTQSSLAKDDTIKWSRSFQTRTQVLRGRGPLRARIPSLLCNHGSLELWVVKKRQQDPKRFY